MSSEITWRFFAIIERIIRQMANGDAGKEQLLSTFVFRLLSVLDGVEGDELDWKGISLVSPPDLPDDVDEINDDFLHNLWSGRDH